MKFLSIEDYGGADSSHRLFTGWGWESVNDPEKADIIIFNGGTDIATEIYGELPVMRGIPRWKSVRDHDECKMFEYYQGKKLMLGICRGAQLLNCLNGGTLWQDVNNHGGSHKMLDMRTGEVLMVTSTHHQQMRPNLGSGVIIGLASQSTDKYAENTHDKYVPDFSAMEAARHFEPNELDVNMWDVEIMWYPKTHTLCIQGHPEYVPGSRFAEYSKQLIESCMAEIKVTA